MSRCGGLNDVAPAEVQGAFHCSLDTVLRQRFGLVKLLQFWPLFQLVDCCMRLCERLGLRYLTAVLTVQVVELIPQPDAQ